MRRRQSPAIVLAAVTAASGASIAQAQPAGSSDLCGWTGNVSPLMAMADKKVRSHRVTEKVLSRASDGAYITEYNRVEIDLEAVNPQATKPTDAATLTFNKVTYNLRLSQDDGTFVISVQLWYDGLCFRKALVVNEAWTGSTGTEKPLKISANKALKLAQQYRRAHPDAFPLDQPLVMMNLMQATTRPPDFGKLRWYVNYDNGMGDLNILAVYMNGKVKVPR